MSAMIPESIRELAAGYALGALTPEETRTFEAAMAESPDLGREVTEYWEVNALLAQSAATRPDPALKARLVDRIRRDKVVPVRAPRSRLAPVLLVALAATALVAVGLGRRVQSLSEEVKRQDLRLVAAEALLAARDQTLNTLLNAESDLTVLQLTTAGAESPGIQFFWNRRSNTGVLHAFRLPPTPQGKVYQLWLLRDGKPYPSATFTTGSDGQALVQSFSLPNGGGFEAAAVTVEPEGGSTTPTLPIYLIGKV